MNKKVDIYTDGACSGNPGPGGWGVLIQLDDKNKTAKLVRVPKFSEVPYPVIMEPSLVIEYYSR